MPWITVLYLVGEGYFVNMAGVKSYSTKSEACAISQYIHHPAYELQVELKKENLRLVALNCAARDAKGKP